MKLIADITVKFNNLYDWCISNKLTINSEKTQFMVFHTPNKPMPNNLTSQYDKISRCDIWWKIEMEQPYWLYMWLSD